MRYKRGSQAHAAVIMTLGIIILCATTGMFIAYNTSRNYNRAHAVSKAQISSFATSVRALEIVAQKSEPRSLYYFYEIVELSLGSDDLRVDNLSVVFSTRTNTSVYGYGQGINCSLDPRTDSSIASLANPDNKDRFGANSRVNPNTPTKYEGVLTRNNMLQLCFTAPHPLPEDEKIVIRVVPEGGQTLVTPLTLPAVFTTEYVVLLQHVA